MLAYIVRRLALIVPTLFGIMLINFAIIQFAPGGPVEQIISQLTGEGSAAIERVTRSGGEGVPAQSAQGSGQTQGEQRYRGAQSVRPSTRQ